jgi:hypothetical protein
MAAIVSGALANKPGNGGEAWVRLSWALGLRRLGVEVTFVEEIHPSTCADHSGRRCPFEDSINLAFFRDVTSSFGLARDACLIESESGSTSGLSYEDAVARANEADMLINLSGHLRQPQLLDAPSVRVYVDLDPGFTQFWAARGVGDLGLERHELHLTVANRVGVQGSLVPAAGYEWLPLLPPILLYEWPGCRSRPDRIRFTTVATWRGAYGPVEHAGRRYGLKLHEFRKFVDLPRHCDAEFEIALAIDEADRPDLEALEAAGWRIVSPRDAISTPASYRDYIQTSDAEFSVAQGIYVETGSGWFSDRTAAYLASAKPALVQDTGFDAQLKRGGGVARFGTLPEAIAGVEAITDSYAERAEAARAVAERHLDSDRVLSDVLELVAARS